MSAPSARLLSLDYLRGFFIVVIIIDHLWRWPSLYELITGRGELWVTTAEGFVIISGLLVGYVRGHKNKNLPLNAVSKKLWVRAGILYGWLVAMTLIYTMLVWYIPTVGNTAWIAIPKGEWVQLLQATVLMQKPHIWVHFLYIYAVLLALTPIVIWLLRRGWWMGVVAFTIAGYIIGRVYSIEALQWMPMFYIPAIAGYYLPNIQAWWKHASLSKKQLVRIGVVGGTLATITASIICEFIIPTSPVGHVLNELFTKEYWFSAWRIPIALLWFVGFVLVFERYKTSIGKWFGWLLIPFGTRSLTGYIIHGFVLFAIALVFIELPNVWYNTAIGTLAIMGTWLLLRLKFIQRYVPS